MKFSFHVNYFLLVLFISNAIQCKSADDLIESEDIVNLFKNDEIQMFEQDSLQTETFHQTLVNSKPITKTSTITSDSTLTGSLDSLTTSFPTHHPKTFASTNLASSNPTSSSSSLSSHNSISGGVIAAILCGSVAFVAMIAGIIFFWIRRKKTKMMSSDNFFSSQPSSPPNHFKLNPPKEPFQTSAPSFSPNLARNQDENFSESTYQNTVLTDPRHHTSTCPPNLASDMNHFYDNPLYDNPTRGPQFQTFEEARNVLQ